MILGPPLHAVLGPAMGRVFARLHSDHALRTSAPDVFAAGDVAASFQPLYGRHVRVEHWANALNGGPAAARSMLGREVVHDRVPYFFTDQYELGMKYSGLAGPGDALVCRVIRRTAPSSRSGRRTAGSPPR